MPVSKRRRRDEDDIPLSVLPPDEDEDDEEDDEEQEVDAEEGIRHARGARPVAKYADEEDAGSDQVIPDRVLPLKLPPPWSHLRIWAWLDYPEEIAKLFGPKAPDETDEEAGERIMEGMRAVITRHDGWVMRGAKLPQPSSRKFWSMVSTPLARAITTSFFSLMRSNPTPAGSRKQKRTG
jgi:hypothetical protein